MAKFTGQCADGGCFLSIDVGGADIGFDGISHDVGHDIVHGVNGSIDPGTISWRLCRIGRTVAEKLMATGAAAGTGCGKILGVAMDV